MLSYIVCVPSLLIKASLACMKWFVFSKEELILSYIVLVTLIIIIIIIIIILYL